MGSTLEGKNLLLFFIITIIDIGVGRFRILGGGGARFRILGGGGGGAISQQAHGVIST